ncbi:MAG: hypothetical protein R3D26_10755 [Cyanobacteriota/Melainabacteria group bacterium]
MSEETQSHAIKDNDHTFSDDHGAMLDAISEMTDAEIDRYRSG